MTAIRGSRLFHRLVGIFVAAVSLTTAAWGAAAGRYFDPTPGYTQAKDMPDSSSGRILSMTFRRLDAFEGSQVNTDAEAMIFNLGNKLHIETHEWVVKRLLPIALGDSVDARVLREAEKALRDAEYIADAVIEAAPAGDTGWALVVTTYDQWTTTPAFSFNFSFDEPVYAFGLVESNVLGTGQRLGGFYGKSLERESLWLDYSNRTFTPQKLHLTAIYAWLSDGYSYNLGLSRPLRTRHARWAFNLSAEGGENSRPFYLSGNDLEKLEDSGDRPDGKYAKTRLLASWDRVALHEANASVTRSFGSDLKFQITPGYSRTDEYLVSDILRLQNDPLWWPDRVVDTPSLRLRRNEMFGASFSVLEYDYKTVHNFRNLKWSETLQTGWRLTQGVYLNFPALGAKNNDTWLSHTLLYYDAFADKVFLNTSLSSNYYLEDGKKAYDGLVSGSLESQVKWHPRTATAMSASYAHLFATEDSRQLVLGEESGLIGFPNFFYSGKARTLFSLEQRYFPPLEFGTMVPALAVFGTAGNAWRSRADVDLGDLHYSLGLGLRLGATRSVQKVVNHINVVWPVGEKYMSGPSFGIRATQSL